MAVGECREFAVVQQIFAEVVAHIGEGGKQRPVDVTTESYHVACDYMVRLGAKDFADEAWVARLAEAGGMPVEEFTGYFGKFAQ